MKSSPLLLFIFLAFSSASPLAAQGTNIAIGKPVSASAATWSGQVPENITDGNLGNQSHPLASSGTLGFYYEIDLGSEVNLERVELVNRSGCCPERLTNYRVELRADAGGSAGAVNWSADIRTDGSNSGNGGRDTVNASLDPGNAMAGRYIRVVNLSNDPYNPQIAELEAFEAPLPAINSFVTDNGNITATGAPGLPTSATLSWQVTNANTVTISNGIGTVPLSGQQVVSPSVTTTYTLTATNSSGSSAAAVTIGVDQPVIPPVLTEFMADNASVLQDQLGNSPDWIEIHNPNGFDLSLDGYFLTDNPGQLMKWRIPAVSVPANGYLIIFASGEDLTDPGDPVHTNFQLSRSGEYLALVDADGTTVLNQFPTDYPTSLTYPPQEQNVSYGLEAGGVTEAYFSPSTPGAANSTGFAGFVEDTKFDIGRGFYTSPINVAITTLTPGATIRYTTDGSDPSPGNGTTYSAPIAISSTTILRAMAYKAGLASTNIDTNTYVFVDDVIASDLGVTVTQQMRDSLTAVPSLSFVTPETINDTSEVLTSFEIIHPDGTEGVQENCGVKRFGGAFTNFDKKNFRLYFRSQYGASKLKYPVFDGFDRGIEATDTFDQLNIRSGSHDMNQRGFYMSNRFTDDSMLDMGNINPHGRFMHLYRNGQYWGVYHVRERWSASTLKEYLGGPKSGYESINGNWNVGGWADPVIDAYDGDGSAWERIKSLATDYEGVKPYLDTTHYIDYMIMWMFGNAEAEYRCSGPADVGSGFKWFLNDADGYLRTSAGNRTNFASNTPGVFGRSPGDGPGSLFSLLFKSGNAEYRMLLADRIHKHFFNDGAMTPARTIARLNERCDEMDLPFYAEAERWGYRSHSNWVGQKNNILNNWLPNRTATVIGYYRGAGFYPSTDAPVFSQHGGDVPPGYNLTMSGGDGTTYYTTDGSDPRLPGGAINPLAQVYQGGEVTSNVFSAGATWKYLDDGSDQGTGWRQIAFDDSSWASGAAELGYGEGDEATVVSFGPSAVTKYTTTYFRRSFNVTNAAALTGAEIRIKRDDGAVVYINGTEAGRTSMPGGTINYQTLANSASDDGNTFQVINAGAGLFQEGSNVIAVEVHQSSLNSSDLTFDLELDLTSTAGGNTALNLNDHTLVRARSRDGGQWSALNEAFFKVGTPAIVEPGDIVISELHYNPPGSDSSEFIELYNISGHAINLRGAFFSDGIRFGFPDNRDIILAPGERALLVDSQFGIDETYGIGLRVIGVYRGDLDNGGETITLLASDGFTVLLNATYDGADPWPEEADGDGSSLVLNRPESNPDPSLVESWRFSSMPGGNPGGPDGEFFSGNPGADNDSDLLPAILEHALGTSDDNSGDADIAFSIEQTGADMLFSYQENLAAEGVLLTIEQSTNLVDWEPMGTALTLVDQPYSGAGILTSVYRIDPTLHERLHLRLKVEELLP